MGRVSNLIDPFRRSGPIRFPFADPVPYHRFATSGSKVPRDAINDEIPIQPVYGVEAYFES